MYSVLIADDNPIICQALFQRIPWEELNLTFLDFCQNGREVSEKCQETLPDILITDIRMPFKDGLSTIEFVRTFHPELQVIIISGYRDTDYLKKAIDEEVVNYLFKPIQDGELVKSLGKAIENLERQKHFLEISQSVKEYTQLEKQRILTERLVDLLRGKPSPPHPVINQLLKEGSTTYRWMLVPLPFQDITCINGEQYDQLHDEIRRLSQEVHQQVFFCLPTPTLLAIFIPTHGVQIDEWVPNILLSFENKKNLKYMSSLTFSTCEEMDVAFNATLLKVFHTVFGCTFYDRPGEEIMSILSTKELQTLRTHLSLADTEGAMNWMELKFNEYLMGCPTPNGMDALIRSLIRFCAEYIPFLQNLYLEIKHIFLISLGFQSIQEFRELIRDKLWDELVFENRVEEVVTYIKQHFTHPLTIVEIAETFHYNSTYLGQLIKQKTGMTFNAYINTLRINYAKDILTRSNDLKVTELAYQVGYTDHRYFSKIFKKITGILPSEYGEMGS